VNIILKSFENIHAFLMKEKEKKANECCLPALVSYSLSRFALPVLIEEVCLCILSLHKHPL